MLESIMVKVFGPSWRTSIAGLGALLAAVGPAIKAWADGDPATVPDWGMVGVAVMVALGLKGARDHRVSSEAAGVRPAALLPPAPPA